ncbi:MAG: NeuD/PglB/VioB family sugar acetyltransferase [Anaerolineales bacterium]|jgi:sugar O-acyltransferase (sialic acid O-acetyltransferase NeuD family)
MIKSEIFVPLLNANEPEARLVEIHVKDKQAVEKGLRLFTIETTKATSEVESPETGFVHVLAKEGAMLSVGDRLAVITETANEDINGSVKDGLLSLPENGLRITKPARTLADLLGVDLTTLPSDLLITEEIVRQAAASAQKMDIKLLPTKKPYLLIFGGGGHAKSIMDLVKQLDNYVIAGILDDDKHLTGKEVLGIPVLGTRVLLPTLLKQGVKQAANGVGGILDINVRIKIFESLEHVGFTFPTLVHPRANVETSALVEEGVQVFANAYVGSEAHLQPRCMVNTNAVVSHDCVIGMYSHIAPGALLAGEVRVGAHTLIGMGVTTAIGVRIGDNVRIGNGAIILADVPDKTIIQAGRFWTGKA